MACFEDLRKCKWDHRINFDTLHKGNNLDLAKSPYMMQGHLSLSHLRTPAQMYQDQLSPGLQVLEAPALGQKSASLHGTSFPAKCHRRGEPIKYMYKRQVAHKRFFFFLEPVIPRARACFGLKTDLGCFQDWQGCHAAMCCTGSCWLRCWDIEVAMGTVLEPRGAGVAEAHGRRAASLQDPGLMGVKKRAGCGCVR
jgi:hypothetical protein